MRVKVRNESGQEFKCVCNGWLAICKNKSLTIGIIHVPLLVIAFIIFYMIGKDKESLHSIALFVQKMGIGIPEDIVEKKEHPTKCKQRCDNRPQIFLYHRVLYW